MGENFGFPCEISLREIFASPETLRATDFLILGRHANLPQKTFDGGFHLTSCDVDNMETCLFTLLLLKFVLGSVKNLVWHAISNHSRHVNFF